MLHRRSRDIAPFVEHPTYRVSKDKFAYSRLLISICHQLPIFHIKKSFIRKVISTPINEKVILPLLWSSLYTTFSHVKCPHSSLLFLIWHFFPMLHLKILSEFLDAPRKKQRYCSFCGAPCALFSVEAISLIYFTAFKRSINLYQKIFTQTMRKSNI